MSDSPEKLPQTDELGGFDERKSQISLIKNHPGVKLAQALRTEGENSDERPDDTTGQDALRNNVLPDPLEWAKNTPGVVFKEENQS